VGRVAVLLSERGVEAYLVGGYVRDLLSGRDTHDVDLALASADSIAIGRAVADALDGAFYVLDDERRYGRVLASGEDGKTVTFDFTPLHGTLKEDLAYRDFTINAMALPMTSEPDPEKIIDPWEKKIQVEFQMIK
jgi:poly(A) polymerase